MVSDKPISFSQGSLDLTSAYADLWMKLLRSDSPELGELHRHMVQRVVMDTSDSPNIRIAVAAALMSLLDWMSSHRNRRNQYFDRTSQLAIGERAELFEQIAAGERTEVEVSLPNGRKEDIVIEAGIRTVVSARATPEPPNTGALRWVFVLGPETPASRQRPVDDLYTRIATHAAAPLLPWLPGTAAGTIAQGEYLAEWLQVFKRTVGRVLLCWHDPAGLRRAYGGVVVTLLHMLEIQGQSKKEPRWAIEDAALEIGHQLGWGSTLRTLGDVCGTIADGGVVLAALYRGDNRLLNMVFADGHRDVIAVHADFQDYEEADLVAALAGLLPEDVAHNETLKPPPRAREPGARPRMAPPVAVTPAAGRPRKHPRPNEPCSCGSGQKYKKCCGGR